MQVELEQLLRQWLQASGDAAGPLTGLGAAVLLLAAGVSVVRLVGMDVLVNMRLLLAESRLLACLGLSLSWVLLLASGLSAALSLAVLAGLGGSATAEDTSSGITLPVLQSLQYGLAALLQWSADLGISAFALGWLKGSAALLLAAAALRWLSWWAHRRQAQTRAAELLSAIDPESPQNKPRATRTLVRYR